MRKAFGFLVALTVLALASPGHALDAPQYLAQWGSYGYGWGQFASVGWLAYHDGLIYVTDETIHAVQTFTTDGTPVAAWGANRMVYPEGIAVAADGTVYVVDEWQSIVFMYTSAGVYLGQFGSAGSGDGQFLTPYGVALDPAGNVYVADRQNNRIQKFTSAGAFITKWGSYGAGDGQMNFPVDVVVADGNVYVVDLGNNRIQEFTTAGAFIRKWGSYGSGDGFFNVPYGITADASSRIYVAERDNSRVQVFDETGNYLTQWGGAGSGNGQFSGAVDVAADAMGDLYVSDAGNYRIEKFGPPGETSYAGLMQNPLGGAGFVALGDSMVVTGIGGSGNDGAFVAMPGFQDILVSWADGGLGFSLPDDAGAACVTQLDGILAGGSAPQPIDRLTQAALTDRVNVSCDFSPVGATTQTIEVWNGDAPVYRQLQPNGKVVSVLQPPPGQIAGAISTSKSNEKQGTSIAISGPDTTVASIGFNPPAPMLIDGTPLTGDKINFICTTGVAVVSLADVQILGTNPGGTSMSSMTLTPEALGIAGGGAQSLGGATLTATTANPSGLLVTTPLDLSGVRACSPTDPVKGVKVSQGMIGAGLANPDSAGNLPAGAELDYRATGIVGGVPDQEIGLCSVTKQGAGVYAIGADLSGLGSPMKQVDVWLGGTIVYSETTSDPAIGTMAIIPGEVDYNVSQSPAGGGGAVVSLNGLPPVAVQVGTYSGQAESLAINEVVLAAPPREPASGPSNALTGVEITQKHIPSLLVKSITATPIPVATSVAGAHAPAGAPAAPRVATWPNPSAGDVELRFALPAAGHLRADIYDVNGRLVRRVADGAAIAGESVFRWDGRTESGERAASGIYFMRGREETAGHATAELTTRFVILR